MAHELDAGQQTLDTVICSIPIVNTNRALKVLLTVLVAAFTSLIAYSLQDKSAKVGGSAPAFSIVTDQGKRVTPVSFGGKVLVLNFWATWCAPCIQEIPSLNLFQRQFLNTGVVVVAVSVDKNAQKYRNFLKRIPLTFETARDPNADVSAQYGTFQYPETYIIKDGLIVRKFAEGEDWSSDDITGYVKSLL